MSSSKPEISVVSAEVNGGEYSPSSLRFSMDVGGFPSVSATISDPGAKVGVHVPMSRDVISRLAKLQEQRLAGRTEPDFNVSADDGLGGTIDYEGFIAAPVLDLSKISTVDRISSVGRAALLDALDLSIYRGGYALERQESGSDLKRIKAAETGNVTEVLRAVTDVLVSNYDAVLADEYMPVAQEMLRIQHEVNNDGPLELWQEILEASDVEYKSWAKAFEVSPEIARALSTRVKDMLETKSDGFWGQVVDLMESFRMHYIPEFNGTGRFERVDKKMEDPQVTIKASVTGLSIADGSSRILPPGGVVMMTRAAPTERQESQADPNIPRAVAYAPNPLLPGFIARASPPFWLLREEGIPILKPEVSETIFSKVKNLDLGRRAAYKITGREYKATVDTVSTGIMTEMCEVMFKEMQLAQSTAVLQLPLDFTLNEHVGKRATIEIESGSILRGGGSFTAFVSGITHSVDLQQGRELRCGTELRLSHASYAT